MAMGQSPTEADSESGLGIRVVIRVLAALTPIALLVVAIRASGLLEGVDVESVRELVERGGFWRIPIFVAIYGLGILAHVPGSVFVAAGVLAFGPVWGLAWSYLGALLGNLLSFGVVRLSGTQPFAGPLGWPIAERLFAHLADRPYSSVIAIRIVFPTTAPINYALALTNVTFRAYLMGSLIGVVPQLAACVALFAFAFA